MGGPPDDIDSDELWQLLHEQPWPSALTEWPRKVNGKTYRVRIRAAGDDIQGAAKLKARRELIAEGYTEAELSDPFIRGTLGDRIAHHILAETVFSAKPIAGTEGAKGGPTYKRMFGSAKDVPKALFPEEVMVLHAAWIIIQNKLGPFAATVATDQDLAAWIKKLAEGGAAFPLAQRDWLQLVQYSYSVSLVAYALFQALESQSQSLPPTLVSALKSYNFGTSYFGGRRVEFTEAGLSFAHLPSDVNVSNMDLSEGAINQNETLVTLESATMLARRLYDNPSEVE